MPSPEQPEQRGGPEGEPLPYYRASRFAAEKPVGRAYLQAQETIYATDNELSTFRFLLDRVWHVAVVGEPPPHELEERLTAILAAGEPTELPTELVRMLQERRQEATKRGPWVERHYRPGKRLKRR